MKLIPLMTLVGRVEAPVEIGEVSAGTRRIFVANGGEFEGERLRGVVRPGGGEWFLQDAEGLGTIDVRLLLETDDGVPIYLRYSGLMDFTPKILSTLAEGRASEYGDNLFLTQARFEVGDPRYAWLNRVIAVGEGRVRPDAVEYRLFEVSHG